MGSKPTILESERTKTVHDLDRVATVTGMQTYRYVYIYMYRPMKFIPSPIQINGEGVNWINQGDEGPKRKNNFRQEISGIFNNMQGRSNEFRNSLLTSRQAIWKSS
jgi:hypothetical protein